MLRIVREPRWLWRTGLLALLLAAFTWLGFWQLGVAYNKGEAQALQAMADRPEVPLDEAISPHQPFPDGSMNRPVTVRGRYEQDLQVLVPERRLDGVTGYWVVTPMLVEGTGARLAVVRGWVREPGEASPADPAPRELHAVLAQPESPPTRFDLPAGQVGSVDISILLDRWGGQVYNAFVFAQAEEPSRVAASSIRHVPPPRLATGQVSWRNLFYALQWWAFGVVAVYVFVRVLREEAAGDGAGGDAGVAPASDPVSADTMTDETDDEE